MNKNKIVVIDYGMGNTLSVCRAFKYCGADVDLTSDIEKIKQTQRLVLPGVGAFASGIEALRKRDLIEVIKDYLLSEKPFLGICLGMQMLLEKSEEYGNETGLNFIKGSVKKIPTTKSLHTDVRLPHIAWNRVKNDSNFNDAILQGIDLGSFFYFVHSYYCNPNNKEQVLATTPFYNFDFPSIIKKGNIYGVQFHPEKSGKNGLQFLSNFLNL